MRKLLHADNQRGQRSRIDPWGSFLRIATRTKQVGRQSYELRSQSDCPSSQKTMQTMQKNGTSIPWTVKDTLDLKKEIAEKALFSLVFHLLPTSPRESGQV
jgi:hypothetical protein